MFHCIHQSLQLTSRLLCLWVQIFDGLIGTLQIHFVLYCTSFRSLIWLAGWQNEYLAHNKIYATCLQEFSLWTPSGGREESTTS